MKLIDYNILSIKKELFSDCDINSEFFESLKKDYSGFEEWFRNKDEQEVYVHRDEHTEIQGFLYLKKETEAEDYSNMEKIFEPKIRMKIGTFKISEKGYYLGERFFKVIFDNALINNINQIYVTIYEHHEHLVKYFKEFGFKEYSRIKDTNELVLLRDISRYESNEYLGYPVIDSEDKNYYILPIYPEFHTKLLPDAILKTEDNFNFDLSTVYGNTLNKVYIGRNLWAESPKSGDIVFFYRTSDKNIPIPAHYQSVVTSIGIVKSYGIISNLDGVDFERFMKKSVLNEIEKNEVIGNREKYRYLEFVYFGKLSSRKVNLAYLRSRGIEAPRGLQRISEELAKEIVSVSGYEEGIFYSK